MLNFVLTEGLLQLIYYKNFFLFLQPLSKVLEIVYNPVAPKWAWRGDSPSSDLPRPVDHHLWCEVTWDHVILTLHEWLHHLRGLEVRK